MTDAEQLAELRRIFATSPTWKLIAASGLDQYPEVDQAVANLLTSVLSLLPPLRTAS